MTTFGREVGIQNGPQITQTSAQMKSRLNEVN
jgi:hypothetical protein